MTTLVRYRTGEEMKMFSESNATMIYNWPVILDRLESGDYTKQEKERWTGAAFSWTTCACGNLCDAIPRYDYYGEGNNLDECGDPGSPLDDVLDELGSEFYECVSDMDIDRAREVLDLIEKRSIEILREMEVIE